MGKPEHRPCLSSSCNSLAGLQRWHAGGPESKPVALTAKPHCIPRRLYLRLIHFLRVRFCPFPPSSAIRRSASIYTVPGHQILEAAVLSGDLPLYHLSTYWGLLGLFAGTDRRGSLTNRALWLYTGLFTWSVEVLQSPNLHPHILTHWQKTGKGQQELIFLSVLWVSVFCLFLIQNFFSKQLNLSLV